jgi:hypothetical protein
MLTDSIVHPYYKGVCHFNVLFICKLLLTDMKDKVLYASQTVPQAMHVTVQTELLF